MPVLPSSRPLTRCVHGVFDMDTESALARSNTCSKSHELLTAFHDVMVRVF